MEKNFKRFTLAVYVLLMIAFYSLLTAGLGLIPGIGLTIAIVLFDAGTAFNSGSTLLYAAVSLFSLPVFALFTSIYERFSSNLPKLQTSPENTDNLEKSQSFGNTQSVDSNLEPKNNPTLFSTAPFFSPKGTQQDESKVELESSVNYKA